MNKHIITTSIILAAVMCLVMAPVVMAQQFTPPTPQSRVDEIGKAVKLTADQRAQILKIYTDAASAQQGGGGGGGMRGGGGGTATTAAVEKVLTPEQVKQWRAYTLKQSVDNRITQIDTAVTLTAEQRKQIVPIIEKEINAQNALTASMQGQGANADRQGMMDKTTEIRTATDNALASILTKEQLAKYQAMPARGGRGGGTRGQ